jgi:hypothetical protein
MALAKTLEFPSISPDGFPVLEREPAFDPARHLALERPGKVVTLHDLGYTPEEIAACPTELGITSCFRILSDEGVACLLEVARNLAPYIISAASSGSRAWCAAAPTSRVSCATCACRPT